MVSSMVGDGVGGSLCGGSDLFEFINAQHHCNTEVLQCSKNIITPSVATG